MHMYHLIYALPLVGIVAINFSLTALAESFEKFLKATIKNRVNAISSGSFSASHTAFKS